MMSSRWQLSGWNLKHKKIFINIQIACHFDSHSLSKLIWAAANLLTVWWQHNKLHRLFSLLMIPWVTVVLSELSTTLHSAATCSVRAASALGPRWALCSKDILPRQEDSKKGEGLLRTALRESYAFCACCCGIKATVGHLIHSQCLHPFTLNRKGTKQKNLHLNTDFFVKIVPVTCFLLKCFQ